MLNELSENFNKETGNLKTKIGNIKITQSDMKNTLTEMKSILQGINGGVNIANDQIRKQKTPDQNSKKEKKNP